MMRSHVTECIPRKIRVINALCYLVNGLFEMVGVRNEFGYGKAS